MLFYLYIIVASLFAGTAAGVSGFGIGSILTPLLSIKLGTKAAIAAVAIPHLIGTLMRFWMLKSYIDKNVIVRFGIASIIGGLIGALLYWKATTPALTFIFGAILIFAGLMELTGFLKKIRLGKSTALIGGALSGFFGGLVGNQGGIRSAALLSFDIDRKTFVATATAIGLVIDAVRMPIYFLTQGAEIVSAWQYIIVAIMGVLIGTWLGTRLLDKIPKNTFRILVATLIIILGLFMFYNGINS